MGREQYVEHYIIVIDKNIININNHSQHQNNAALP